MKRPVVARAALDRALDEKEDLLLVYQPIHDARNGEIRAVEALMRQRRRSGEIREASIISQAAEKSAGGELFMLDHVLIRKAYRDAAKWHAHHPDPLDGLKLAGTFVKRLPGDARCAAIVRHMIALAHDLDLDVVAEEVERQDQLDLLTELDCDSIQGFLFSRPMTAAKLQAALAPAHGGL